MGAVDKPRVLVVDDEVPFGNLFVDPKYPWSRRWDCVHEPDPNRALDLLCRPDQLFDVILLDIIMPHLNGMVLYDKLLLLAPARRLRVVFLTGGALIPAVDDFLEDHHHILKPATAAEIEKTVEDYASLPLSRGPR